VALPALQVVRESFAGAHITLLSNADMGAARVSTQDLIPAGLINEWLTYPSNENGADPFAMIRLLASLRRREFDTLVYLAPRLRSPLKLRRDLIFFRLAGIRHFIGNTGFEPLPRKIEGKPLAGVVHEVDHLLHRLRLSGLQSATSGDHKINLHLTGEEQEAAERWLLGHATGYPNTSLIGFGPGSKWPSKVWPEHRFAELGERLIDECDVYPVIFGGVEDRALGERLIRAWGKGANAAGTLPVRQSAAALARCQAYVGNDTGTMHLASAVDTPCVVTMSAQDWPGHWDPYGSGHTVLRRSLPCEGCMLKVCKHEGLRCLQEILVAEVLDACKGTLGRVRAEPKSLATSH